MSLQCRNRGLEKTFKTLIIILFFSYLFISFLQPLADPDTPWHLKTGEYIFLHKTIPTSDPFSFAKDTIPFYGKFILSQYWLSQLFFFSIYKIAGPFGLIMTGAILFTVLLFLLWILLRDKGFYISLFLVGGFAFNVLQNYYGIRPQIFTFLFAVIVLFLLEKNKEKDSLRYLFPLPFLMLLWANIHGGFIYGIVLMAIYVLSDGFKLYRHNRNVMTDDDRISSKSFRHLLIFFIISVLVSLINPNTYQAFLYVFVTHSQNLFANIDEYRSPLNLMTARIHPKIIYSFWAYLVVAAILIIIFLKSRIIFPILILLFAILPTLFSIRYIPLFAIVAVTTFRYVPVSGISKISLKVSTFMNFSIIILLGVLIFFSHSFKNNAIFRMGEFYHYPVRAADFLIKNKISGNIFSSYNKSAYLLFRLFPKSKLYSDSRYINEERIKKSAMIIGEFDSCKEGFEFMNKLIPENIGTIRIEEADRQKQHTNNDNPQSPNLFASEKKWKILLNDINADIIVSEAVNLYSGNIYPMVLKLVKEDTWKLIYLDGSVMIFVKDIPKFKEIIAHHSKSKILIYDEIIKECLQGTAKNISGYYSSMALAFLLKGIADKNTEFFIEKSLSLDPNNMVAIYAKIFYTLIMHKKSNKFL